MSRTAMAVGSYGARAAAQCPPVARDSPITSDQLIQAPEPQHLVRVERLGVRGVDARAEVRGDRLDHLAEAPFQPEALRLVAADRAHLLVDRVADVDAERRGEIHPQVGAEV